MINFSNAIKNDLSGDLHSASFVAEIKIYEDVLQDPNLQTWLIGSESQKLSTQSDLQNNFAIDLDLKVTSINEKIDMKTKKIQVSNVSVTFSNHIINNSGINQRFSDLVPRLIGADIDLYLVTPSCEDLQNDGELVAKLKINRYSHTKDLISISADDVTVEGFYKDIPSTDYILTKEQNTFEHYNNRVVPLLYGQLDSAPAIIYVENYNPADISASHFLNNEIKVICDTAYLDDTRQIVGIKFALDHNPKVPLSRISSYEQRSLQINTADTLCDVICSQYDISRQEILDLCSKAQYKVDMIHGDHITLLSQNGNDKNIISDGGMWISRTRPVVNKQQGTWQNIVSVPDSGNSAHGWLEESTDPNKILGIKDERSINTEIIEGFNNWRWSGGVQHFEFDPIGSPDIYEVYNEEGRKIPLVSDITLVGNFDFKALGIMGTSSYTSSDGSGCTALFMSYHFSKPYYSPYAISPNTALEGFYFPDFANPQSGLNDTLYTYITPIAFYTERKRLSDNTIVLWDSEEWDGGFVTGTSSSENLHVSSFKSFAGYESPNIEDEFQTSFRTKFRYTDIYDQHTEPENKLIEAPLASNDLTIYYLGRHYYLDGGYNFDGNNRVDIDLETREKSIGVRKTWAEKNVFENDFYVNAKGKLDNDRIIKTDIQSTLINNNNVKRIKSIIHCKPTNNAQQTQTGFDTIDNHDSHFHMLENALRSKKYKYIDGKVYQVALKVKKWGGERDINNNILANTANNNVYADFLIYDIDLIDTMPTNVIPTMVGNISGGDRNFHLARGNLIYYSGNIAQLTEVTEEMWDETNEDLDAFCPVIGKTELVWAHINYSITNPDIIQTVDYQVFDDYAFRNTTINWEDANTIHYGQSGYDSNNAFDYNTNDWNDYNFGLTNTWTCPLKDSITSEYGWYWGLYGPHFDTTEVPYAIVYNHNEVPNAHRLIEKPTEIIRDIVNTELLPVEFDDDKYKFAYNNDVENVMSLSINEIQNSKDVIENICRQSRLFFRYRPRDNKAILESLKAEYTQDDVDYVIDTDKIYNYTFSKTSIEDLCFAGCKVEYNKSYHDDKFENLTKERKPMSPTATVSDLQILQRYAKLYGVQETDSYRKTYKAEFIRHRAVANNLRDYYYSYFKNQHLVITLDVPFNMGMQLEVGDVISFNKEIDDVKPYGFSIMEKRLLIDQFVYPYFIVTKTSKSLDKVTLQVEQLHSLIERDLPENYDYTTEVEEQDDFIIPAWALAGLGDVNSDGNWDVLDIVIIVNHILDISYLDSDGQVIADVDENQQINVLDIVALMSFIFEGG
jgi:hypothetical protein